MRYALSAVQIDCAGDPLELARWWQGLLGGEIEVDDDGAELHADGFPEIDFYPRPEAKTIKNRVHLDLRPVDADFDAAVAHALAHGATRADDVYDGGAWQVLRDPEGNEFCVLRPRSG